MSASGVSGQFLENLYQAYTHPEYVHIDPLTAVLRYTNPEDQEVVGLIAAALAFGNVKTILRSVDAVLTRLPQPAVNLRAATPRELQRMFGSFRHRYARGRELADLLAGMQRVMRTHGSLGACFRACTRHEETDYRLALTRFVCELRKEARLEDNYLLPDPRRGSACKRLWLYLRWMVRNDAVDPGVWPGLDAAKLIVPLDTHMHRICRKLSFTERKTADLRTAVEITEAFRCICPEDPVRYDFALTRLGILRIEADFTTIT